MDRPFRLARSPFGLTIFLSAFLLFWVQLLLGKYILPWFGGAAAVWTTCMLFFQVLLLAGYAYAHWLNGLKSRTQAFLHCGLLAGSVVPAGVPGAELDSPSLLAPPGSRSTLIIPSSNRNFAERQRRIAFFVLSSTGPLLQAWYWRAYGQGSPYRLYSLEPGVLLVSSGFSGTV